MNNDKLIALLDNKIKASINGDDSPLSKERTDVLKYYKGDKPEPYHKGNSKFVSLDVYDAVESMKANLLETFSGSEHAVRFAPTGKEDVELAEIATQYCDYVVHRQNNGFKLFGDVIHDGLTARAGIAKAYWQQKTVYKDETHTGLDVMTFDALLAEDDVELVSYTVNETSQTIDCVLRQGRDDSKIVIEAVPPEEFLIEKGAITAERAFLGHRTVKSYAELIGEGYDKKVLDKLDPKHEDCLSSESERVQRHFDSTPDLKVYDDTTMEAAGKGAQRYFVTECYPLLDLEDEGVECRWKIIKVANVILHKQKVSRHPFHFFTPLDRPHVFWGDNFAVKAFATQNAKTVLTRSVLDHTVITNNPRWLVVKGALPNPNEMLDNRVGGLVNVSRPDGLAPLPQGQLNPYVFDTIKLLDEGNEGRTGVSRLSQGLNKDALSKQNAADMVSQLTTLSMVRQKVIARTFATNFLAPLFLHVYELVLEHEDRKKVFEVAGNWVEIDPSTWATRKDVTVEFRLGAGEREKDAERLMMVYQMFSQDPLLQPMFQEKHRYALLTKVFNQMGIKDAYKFLAAPEEVKPPEPDPVVMKQLEIQERQVAVAEMQAKTAMRKLELDHQFRMAQLDQTKVRDDADAMIKARDEHRKEFEAASRHDIAQREMDLAEKAPASTAEAKTIISPNS